VFFKIVEVGGNEPPSR